MMKEIILKTWQKNWRFVPFLSICLIFSYAGTSCISTSKPVSGLSSQFGSNSTNLNEAAQYQHLWAKRMKGAIADFALSGNGKAILVATYPDNDIEGSARQYLMTRLDEAGEPLWQYPMDSPARDEALSWDGSFGVVTDYDRNMFGIDSSGKRLWSAEDLCKPYIVDQRKEVICYHDDDAGSEVAYEVFRWNGKRNYSQPSARDVLAFKLSENKKYAAMAFTEGEFALENANHKKIWHRKVSGEIIDVAVSSEAQPQVAVLFRASGQEKSHQKNHIAILDFSGHVLTTTVTSFKTFQVEFSPKGRGIFLYGNSKDGQMVAYHPAPNFGEGWRRGGGDAAAYSTSIVVTNDFVVLGYQDDTSSESSETPRNHLLIYDYTGNLKSNIPIVVQEDAHLYTFRVAGDPPLLVIATDDGWLNAFKLK